MSKPDKKRPRRIASDEALAWARNLRLGNVHAKIILMMLALYVDGEGVCWVGIGSLAEDCELSEDTIRRRLGWLAEVGAIARAPQWIDENGRRNTEGKGRRTTDLIRLLYEADGDEIEAKAKNPNGPVSPSQQQGSDDAASPSSVPSAQDTADAVSPRLAPDRPSHCSEGLDSSEPEPEDSPQSPPPGGVCEDAPHEGSGTVAEPGEFASFWASYPGHEVMSRFRALEIFTTLTFEEQRHARAAAPLLRETLANMKRRPRDAHKWLAEKGWKEFPQAAGAPNVVSISLTYPTDTAEAKALLVVHDICGLGTGFRKIFVGKDKLVRYKKPMTKRILAFATIPPRDTWQKPTMQQAQAWTEFFREVAALNLMKRIDSHDYVPWPWPPKADGTIYTATGPPPALTAAHETEDDLANFS